MRKLGLFLASWMGLSTEPCLMPWFISHVLLWLFGSDLWISNSESTQDVRTPSHHHCHIFAIKGLMQLLLSSLVLLCSASCQSLYSSSGETDIGSSVNSKHLLKPSIILDSCSHISPFVPIHSSYCKWVSWVLEKHSFVSLIFP